MHVRQSFPSALIALPVSLLATLLATLLVTAAPDASAQVEPVQQTKLVADDPVAFAQMGYSVAVSGVTAVVGAPEAVFQRGGSHSGAAYVFVREGASWRLQAHLQPDGGFDHFVGGAVAIDGDTAVVVAADGSTFTNALCVFVREGRRWRQQATLVGDGPGYGFGTSVAISGGTIAVGAPQHPFAGLPTAGIVYVFARRGATWTLQARLKASDADAADYFGSAVALSGNTLLVGAPLDDNEAGLNAGSGYVFVRRGGRWTEHARLTDPNGAPNDQLGSSVALDRGVAALGAPGSFVAGSYGAGAVITFVRTGTTWSPQARLSAGDPGFVEAFGASVALSRSAVVVGAPGDAGPTGTQQGAAYLFVRGPGGAWTQGAKLAADAVSPFPGNHFGAGVAIAGGTMIVGAPTESNAGGVEAGAAYAYQLH